jgi:NADH-quinone oxidoreductase subunit G
MGYVSGVQKLFKKIGALTSKSYAFVARPWELEKINVVDYFDSFGSSAVAELRGFDLMRILPRVNHKVNEEWLTDRARFFFDGLRYQRLLFPLIRKSFGFVPISWEFVKNFFLNLYRIIPKKNFNNDLFSTFFFNAASGEADDLFRQLTLKVLAQRSGNFTFYSSVRSGFFLANVDSVNQFLLPSIDSLEETGLLIIGGFDLRFELPLLLVKVRSLVEKGSLKVIFFGVNSANLKVRHVYGGSSFEDLLCFFAGKHKLSRKLFFEPKMSFCFLSFEFSQKLDLIAMNNIFTDKVKFTTVFSHLGLYKLNQIMIGLTNTFKSLAWNAENNSIGGLLSLSLLSSNNEVKLLPYSILNSFVLYVGSHGDFASKFSSMVIPSSLIYERVNYYINMFSQYQISAFVYAPKRSVRDSLFFFFFLNKVFFSECVNIYDTLKDSLIKFVFIHLGVHSVCDFFNENVFQLSHFVSLGSGRFITSYMVYFSNFLSNSYIIDSFSKNSRVLSIAALEQKASHPSVYNMY